MILNRNQTTWGNTGARLTPTLFFYEPTVNQKIAIRERGWEKEFNDSMGHLGNMDVSKHEKGMKEALFELKSFFHGQRMGSNSAGHSEISGSLVDRITKTLIYGKLRKSETDLRIGEIKNALSDFAKRAKNKMIGKKSNIRKEGIKFKKIEKL